MRPTIALLALSEGKGTIENSEMTGGNIFTQVSAAWTGRDAFELGAPNPWINGTHKQKLRRILSK